MEAVGLAASIIGIAGAGAKVATTLTKFSISVVGADKKLEEIAARASLSATILHAIGETVKENETLFKKAEFLATWREVLGAASGSYARLEAGLEKARGPGKKKSGMGVWKKFVWGLGGEDRAKELDEALDRCCGQVMMMQQVIQWKVLQRIVPTDKDVQEKEELKEKLDWIVQNLAKSGLIPPPKPVHPGKPDSIVKPYQQDRGDLNAPSNDSSKPTNNDLTGSGFNISTVGASTAPSPNSMVISSAQLFEAYYFIPDILEDDQYHGALRVTPAKSNNYLAVYIDIDSNATSQMLVSNAKLRNNQSVQAIMRRLRYAPKAAQIEIEMFSRFRTESSNGIVWTIADFQEFDFVSDRSTYGGSDSDDNMLSAFLVVFRARDEALNSPKSVTSSTPVPKESERKEDPQRMEQRPAHMSRDASDYSLPSFDSNKSRPLRLVAPKDDSEDDLDASLAKARTERESEYKGRLQHELRKSGVDKEQIAVILKEKDTGNPLPNRPVYTRLSRRHLSIETLNQLNIDYVYDKDSDYILIKRWVPEHEQEFLWKHTSELRNARHLHESAQTAIYAIEDKKLRHSEAKFEWVRKKDKTRTSPSSLLTYLSDSRRVERKRNDEVSGGQDAEIRDEALYVRRRRGSGEDPERTQRLDLEERPRRRYSSGHRREEEARRQIEHDRRRVEEEAAFLKLQKLRLQEQKREETLKGEEEKVVFKARGRRRAGKDKEIVLSEKQAETILDQFLATFSV